jgi:hypothetical protein
LKYVSCDFFLFEGGDYGKTASSPHLAGTLSSCEAGRLKRKGRWKSWRSEEKTMKRKLFNIEALLAVLLAMGICLAGCATESSLPKESLIIRIGASLPTPEPGSPQIADGSYVCSRAALLSQPALLSFGYRYYVYNGTKYVPIGTKSVAIRINQGKVTEIMAVQQGQGETASTYATATRYYSVTSPVLIPSAAYFDKMSDFNEAKAMLH